MNSTIEQTAIGFAVDDDKQIIFSRAGGIVSRADVLSYIEAKTEAGVLGYAELFDARDMVVDLSTADLPVIGTAMRKAAEGKEPAKTAVVTNSAMIYGLAKRYAEITRADNPLFKVFTDYNEARTWVSGDF